MLSPRATRHHTPRYADIVESCRRLFIIFFICAMRVAVAFCFICYAFICFFSWRFAAPLLFILIFLPPYFDVDMI